MANTMNIKMGMVLQAASIPAAGRSTRAAQVMGLLRLAPEIQAGISILNFAFAQQAKPPAQSGQAKTALASLRW